MPCYSLVLNLIQIFLQYDMRFSNVTLSSKILKEGIFFFGKRITCDRTTLTNSKINQFEPLSILAVADALRNKYKGVMIYIVENSFPFASATIK